MELRERLRRALVFSREFTERLLGDLESPDQWLTPPVEGTNHALWIAGHLAVADDAFTGMMDPARSERRDNYRTWFGRGSQPSYETDHYDSPDQIMAYLRERRQALLLVLDELPDADFTRATPDTAPPFMYDYGSVFHMAAWHESLHTGQLTLIRRRLGHVPVR